MGGGKSNAKNVRKRESAVKTEQTISNGNCHEEKIDNKRVQINFAQCYLALSVGSAVFSLAMVIILVNRGGLNDNKDGRHYTIARERDSITSDEDLPIVQTLDEADSLFFQVGVSTSIL